MEYTKAPLVPNADVRSKSVILLLFIYCLLMPPFTSGVGFLYWSLFGGVVLGGRTIVLLRVALN